MTGTDKLFVINAVAVAMERGIPEYAACRKLGVSLATSQRWRRVYAAKGIAGLEDQRSGHSGRHPMSKDLTPAATAYVRRLAVACGSVASAFDQLAADPFVCPPELQAYLLGRRSRHTIATSLRRAVSVTPEIEAMRHGPKQFDESAFIGLRDMTQIDPVTGMRVPIEPADWWELDDQSTNQPFWFELDRRDLATRNGTADALAQRHGVGLGRQGLFCVDIAAGEWLACELVGRPRDAYRAEDILRFLRRLFEDFGLPRRGIRLERGVWQSNALTGKVEMPESERQAVVAGLSNLGIHVEYVYRSRGKPFVEGGFNHLQTRMAIEAQLRGFTDIGRHRSDMERESSAMLRCKAGSRHPRDCGFPHISELAQAYHDAFAFLNAHAKEGRLQVGIPGERWEQSIQASPLRKLSPEHAAVFMPVKFTTKIVGGHVDKTLDGVLYRFALPELTAKYGNGYRVHVSFDPGDPWRGSEVCNLETGTRNVDGLRIGQWMATGEWAEPSPQFGISETCDTAGQRKRYTRAFRAAYAAADVAGVRGRRAAELRTDGGLLLRDEGRSEAVIERSRETDAPGRFATRTDADLDQSEADAAAALAKLQDLALRAG